MEIKRLHAHFMISTGNYNNERVGYSVELNEGESIEEVVTNLREKAIKAIGPSAQEFYDRTREFKREYLHLEEKLNRLRKEWDATAAFLKAQGLNPEAPSMPQFRNLLKAVTVQSEIVTEDNFDEDDEDDEDDENDDF